MQIVVPPFGPALSRSVASVAAGLTPGEQCLAAIRFSERAIGIPEHLLAAIARVESGRPDGQGGVQPWPWSINVEGTDHIYETKAAAIAGVHGFQALGSRSIDVGCLQVNLLHHPDAFESLDAAFDPARNADYAARFLKDLFDRSGSWERATAMYHSATPGVGEDYQRKVAAALPEESRRPAGPGALAQAWGTPGSPPAGVGAIMLSNRAGGARVIFAAPGTPSRGLDSYRAAPVPISSRFIPRPLG
jgi:hypothetical protein